jgi:hypothetical protein
MASRSMIAFVVSGTIIADMLFQSSSGSFEEELRLFCFHPVNATIAQPVYLYRAKTATVQLWLYFALPCSPIN